MLKNLRGLKVLLIDDDAVIREALSLFFEDTLCFLKAVNTAEECIDLLAKKNFDVIIIDYDLPCLNAFELLKWLKNSKLQISIIFITTYGLEALDDLIKQMGVIEVIKKPLNINMILESLNTILKTENYCAKQVNGFSQL